jgi:S-adenosylmethionine:tRNA ribosyltransferase-isomerase
VPPYLNRSSEDIDYKRYQTIFGEFPGSVAAPTAGLHFTEEVFRKLSNKNIQRDYLTLHVGAGTFKPVKSKKISEHTMHTEHFIITKENVKNLIESHENLCIVGTTTVRALESFYYVLIKINQYKKIDNSFFVGQWDPYIQNNENNFPGTKTLLENCLNLMNRQKIENIYCSTQIMILPRYKFKFTKRLITNFHQPKSTLLLLVSALVGEKWKEIYEYAIKNDFRFLSYGDSCLLTSSE